MEQNDRTMAIFFVIFSVAHIANALFMIIAAIIMTANMSERSNDLTEIMFTVLRVVSVSLFIIGGYSVLLGIAGCILIKFGNRNYLIVYLIAIGLLLLASCMIEILQT